MVCCRPGTSHPLRELAALGECGALIRRMAAIVCALHTCSAFTAACMPHIYHAVHPMGFCPPPCGHASPTARMQGCSQQHPATSESGIPRAGCQQPRGVLPAPSLSRVPSFAWQLLAIGLAHACVLAGLPQLIDAACTFLRHRSRCT